MKFVATKTAARSLDELEPAFNRITDAGMQAVSITPEGVFYQGRAIIPKLALARHLPTCASELGAFHVKIGDLRENASRIGSRRLHGSLTAAHGVKILVPLNGTSRGLSGREPRLLAPFSQPGLLKLPFSLCGL